MRNSAVIILVLIFSLTVFSQKSKTGKNPSPTPAKIVKTTAPEPPKADPGNEKEEFEKAVAITDDAERIAALRKFLENFPQSAEKVRAQELIVTARAAIADEKLRLNDEEAGVELFKTAVKEAPQPVSDKFFNEILLKFPTNLYWRGQTKAAFEVARMVEEKAAGNAKQLLGLAAFYLGTENAVEAQRLAVKSLGIEPNLPNAYQTLGLAYRLNFQLEESADAYKKALELDANSLVSKRSLAEMKRAVGKPSEAAAFYREILAVSPDDQLSQTGLALSLFDSENRAEAEAEMSKALEANPNNLLLLVGAAYWYAAHAEGAKAVELAEKAVSIEPRYTWAHIALARGLLLQKQPLEAEKTLLIARQYGNFPTLDYEIATARLQAGFFREAADELAKNFRVEGETITTRLGGRVEKSSKTFLELLAMERRASIFQTLAADDIENSNRLRALLDFNQRINEKTIDETAVAQAADEFVKGDDKMKVHRELFAANRLLQKKTAPGKAFELAQKTVGNTDAALEVPSASAAVLADELYETRTDSISRNRLIIVPNIPRQTLSAILRGRIEEISGWSLYLQGKPVEAAVRLKRAVSVLPEKSAWWRSSMWRLGASLEADGKEKEALDYYIKSYPKDAPDAAKYIAIESLYKKLNGTTDGLEAKIGEKPASAILLSSPSPAPETVAQNTEKPIEPTPAPEVKNEPKPEKTPEIKEPELPENVPAVETSPTPAPEPTPENAPEKTENVQPKTSETPSTELKVEPVAEKIPEPTPEIKPNVTETPTPTPETKSETPAETIAQPTPEIIAENKPAETPKNETEQPKTAEKSETSPNASPTPKPLFEPVIITVPGTELPKPPVKTPDENAVAKAEPTVQPPSDVNDGNENKSEEKSENTAPKTEEKPVENNPANNEVKPNEPPTEKPSEKPVDENIVSGENRPRVIVEDKLPQPSVETCPMVVSQENVSLLNGGGSIGILVGFEKDGNLSDIQASSSSPNDIEIAFEPEIGARSGKAFFIIKSISTKTGEFKVIFEAPCGKKEINVRVR